MWFYLYCGFLRSTVLVLLVFGLATTTRAEEPNCISRNLGDILLGDGSKIPEVSGITRRAPDDVYLISDRTNWLYHARLSGGRWSVDRYGITDLSKGTGPNKDGIYDIEDVSYGPCPVKSEGKCIFIGETGGNPYGKKVFKIHYILESDLDGRRNKFVKTRQIRYRYPEGRKFDAEGLALHPHTGELFVVTKTEGSTSYIYKVDPRFPERNPTKVVVIDLGQLFKAYNTNARQITGFEISPDGTQFAIVTYEALVKFNLDLSRVNHRKLPGNTKSEIFSLLGDWWGKGESLRRIQVEAITYDGGQSHFLVIGEGRSTLMGLNCPAPIKKPVIPKKPPVPINDCIELFQYQLQPYNSDPNFLNGYSRSQKRFCHAPPGQRRKFMKKHSG